MKSAEGRGRTLDEAVDAALIELGESRRNVDVKILSEGPEETHVEVSIIEQGVPAATGTATAPEGAMEASTNTDAAKEIVGQLLARMGIRCSVTARATPESIV